MKFLNPAIFTLVFLLGLQNSSFGQTGTPPAGYCGGTTTNGPLTNNFSIRAVLMNDIFTPQNLYTDNYVNWDGVGDPYGPATVVAGQQMHISVQDGSTTYPHYLQAWIDYDQDGDFEASEKLNSQGFNGGTGNVAAMYFNVPQTATLGNTYLRVRNLYNTDPTDGCAAASYGQTFDYPVTIVGPLSTLSTPLVFDGGNIVQQDADLVHITNVSIGSINNSSTGYGTNAGLYNYSNYTWIAPTDITAGSSQTLSISKSAYDGTLAAWIDWNNDGDFLDADEEIGMAHYPSTNTATFNFTAPAGLSHNTQSTMRVRVVYDNVTATLTPTNTTWGSANSNNNNETEDYRVNFVNPSVCYTPSVTAQANATATTYNMCAFGEDIALTGNASGTGGNCTGSFVYSWYNGTNYWNGTAFASATPVFDASYEDITATNVTANTTFTVEVQCSNDATCSSTSSVDAVYDASAVFLHPTSGSESYYACSGTYYDSGNSGGNYANSSNNSITFYPCNSTDKVQLDFSVFDTEGNDNWGGPYDYMTIYDGNSTGAPVIDSYYGYVGDPLTPSLPLTPIVSTAVDGSLTIYFYSDNNTNYDGWAAAISCISPPSLVCAEVANPAIAIGNPANGTNHHLNLTWDALTGATEYDVEVSTTGTFTGTPTATVATNSYDFDAGDNPNVQYYFQVRASDGSTDCDWTDFGSLYTAADNPALPTVNNATGTTLDVTLVNETPVNNPAITTYSIQEDNSGLYVQANGSLGATEVFQTKATWGTVAVTGLSSNTEYCFVATAQNGDGDTRGGGANVQTTETFDASGSLATTGNPTNVFYSPATCTSGGLAWNASNGCTDGAVGFSGNWVNFGGCYLRTPNQNCTGLNSVTMTFDLSNSYFASQPNDRVYFNMWAPTAGNPGGTYISATSVNGTPTDELSFSSLRNCETVTVEFDLATVTDKSAILYYIHADCAYNNANVFYVWLDNVNIQETAPSTCATTLAIPQPDLIVETITPDVLSLCGSGTVDYDVEVKNDGTQAIASGTNFTVTAYVGSLACGGTAVATQTVTSGLAVGASTTLTFSLALSGSSDVSFNVDNGTAIAELDEGNNCESDNAVVIGSGLGGTYTIDATQATGGTNFNSFADAASALNAQGVCSAVVFNIRTDTYNENFTLTDVAGVSATNTITYQSQSGNAADAVLASTAFSDVIVLHNADYVTFKDMTISYGGTSSYSAIEIQDDADNVTVTNCVLTSSSTSSSFSSSLIYVNESSTSLLIDNLVVENSTLNGGSRGVSFNSGSAESAGIRIEGNTFTAQISAGVYVDDATAVLVTGNTITSTASSGTSYNGIEVENSAGGVTIAFNTITGNNVKHGIELNASDATSGAPNKIYNNFVGLGGTYNQVQGIYLNGSDYVDVNFNNVNIFTTSNTLLTAGLYLTSTFVDGSVNVANNVFAMSSGLSAHAGVYLASTNNRADIGTIDYNNYYAPGSSNVAYSSGNQTLAQWQTLLSDDANSLEIDPQFTSATDLHVAAAALGGAGTAIAGITTDIDGDVRATPPAIGADETSTCTQGLWAGTISSSWSTAGNWDCNTVPTITTDVVIPTSPSGGNFPEVDVTNAVARALEVESGATLSIASGQTITTDGDVTNNGTVIVENGGNFIQTQNATAAHAGTGNFVVKRQSVGGYNGWSTPVVGGTLPGGSHYWYNSDTGTSDPLDDNNPDPDPGWFAFSGAMQASRGYYASGSGTATFTGKANNGTYNSVGITSEGAPGTRYNLVGNPYPSSIDADQFINDNSATIDGSLYFWDDDNTGSSGYTPNDYATYTLAGGVPTIGGTNGGGPTPTGNIASCQGFFVSCTSSGNILFNNGQRGGSNNQFFRMAASNTQRMWLSINNDNLELFNQTLVAFDEDATDQKDWGIDAIKFRGNQNISIGAQQDNETYAIATYESIPQSGKVIPLMTFVETAATYTFVADSMEGFDNYHVFLEDLSNGSLYPMEQGDSYSFAMTSADEYNRFQLWFSPVLVTDVDDSENDFNIYATPNNMIVVETASGDNFNGTVQITDMAGREVLTNDISITNGIGRVQAAGLANGVYAITFVTADGNRMVSHKVALGR